MKIHKHQRKLELTPRKRGEQKQKKILLIVGLNGRTIEVEGWIPKNFFPSRLEIDKHLQSFFTKGLPYCISITESGETRKYLPPSESINF